MTIADWLMITAVLLGPIIAVRLTRKLDEKKEIRERKLWVFKTLMATRAMALSPQHVEALNKIDLEFDTKNEREKEVINAWKEYLDLLGDRTLTPEQWGVKRVDLFVELLHKMAKVLDYEFDKIHIKKSSYCPSSYSELETDQQAIRKGLMDLFRGERTIPVHITNMSTPEQPSQPAGQDEE